MIELTKAQEQKLDCICLLCDHDCMDKSCLGNKIMDALNGEQEQKKQFLKLLEEVVKKNTPKNTRAKMKEKKG